MRNTRRRKVTTVALGYGEKLAVHDVSTIRGLFRGVLLAVRLAVLCTGMGSSSVTATDGGNRFEYSVVVIEAFVIVGL
jgi:hypothetical protein